MTDALIVLQALVRAFGLTALVVVFFAAALRAPVGPGLRNVLLTSVFTLMALCSMLEPMAVPGGVTLGCRGIVVALTVFFAGFPAGLIAAAASSIFRLWQGGPAQWAGVLAIWIALVTAIVCTILMRRGEVGRSLKMLPILGAATSLSSITLLMVPSDKGFVLFSGLLPVIVSTHTMGATLLGSMLLYTEAHHEVEEMTRAEARTDLLTQVANRRYFEHRLRQEMGRQHGEPVALMLVDVDHLKSINDRFGHAEGDRVLKVVGEALLHVVRSSDIAARVGGDEFAVLLPHCSAATARAVAERLREYLRKSGGLGGEATVSIGIAERTSADKEMAGLMVAADTALYQSKHSGRDRVFIHRSLTEERPPSAAQSG